MAEFTDIAPVSRMVGFVVCLAGRDEIGGFRKKFPFSHLYSLAFLTRCQYIDTTTAAPSRNACVVCLAWESTTYSPAGELGALGTRNAKELTHRTCGFSLRVSAHPQPSVVASDWGHFFGPVWPRFRWYFRAIGLPKGANRCFPAITHSPLERCRPTVFFANPNHEPAASARFPPDRPIEPTVSTPQGNHIPFAAGYRRVQRATHLVPPVARRKDDGPAHDARQGWLGQFHAVVLLRKEMRNMNEAQREGEARTARIGAELSIWQIVDGAGAWVRW
jgi:hypothetical protein